MENETLALFSIEAIQSQAPKDFETRGQAQVPANVSQSNDEFYQLLFPFAEI